MGIFTAKDAMKQRDQQMITGIAGVYPKPLTAAQKLTFEQERRKGFMSGAALPAGYAQLGGSASLVKAPQPYLQPKPVVPKPKPAPVKKKPPAMQQAFDGTDTAYIGGLSGSDGIFSQPSYGQPSVDMGGLSGLLGIDPDELQQAPGVNDFLTFLQSRGGYA